MNFVLINHFGNFLKFSYSKNFPVAPISNVDIFQKNYLEFKSELWIVHQYTICIVKSSQMYCIEANYTSTTGRKRGSILLVGGVIVVIPKAQEMFCQLSYTL